MKRQALLVVLLFGAAPTARPQTPVGELLARAATEEKREDFRAAERTLRQALAASPGNIETLKRLGINLQTQLRFQESVDTFQKALSFDRRYAEVNFYLGLSYLGMNEFERSVDSFRKELEVNSSYRRARYYMSIAYQALKRPAAALEQLHMLSEEDPSDTRVLYELARTHKALSLLALRKLSDVAPDSDLVLALRAESSAQSENYAEAVKAYEDLKLKNAKFPGIHFGLGEVYFKMLRFAEAETELRLALREDPNHPMANYYLAEILLRAENAADAIPLLQISLAADSGFVQAYLLLGKCYLGMNKLDDALKALSKAEELDPESRMTHYQLSRLYQRLSDPEKQKRHLETFQKLENREREKQRPTR